MIRKAFFLLILLFAASCAISKQASEQNSKEDAYREEIGKAEEREKLLFLAEEALAKEMLKITLDFSERKELAMVENPSIQTAQLEYFMDFSKSNSEKKQSKDFQKKFMDPVVEYFVLMSNEGYLQGASLRAIRSDPDALEKIVKNIAIDYGFQKAIIRNVKIFNKKDNSFITNFSNVYFFYKKSPPLNKE